MSKKKKQRPHPKTVKSTLDLIRSDIANGKSVIKRNQNPREHTKEIKTLSEGFLRETKSFLRRKNEGEHYIAEYKFDDISAKRRIAAICEYAPIATEKLRTKFPDIDIIEQFCSICMLPLTYTPDITNRYYNIVLACALYILDELLENYNIYDAMLYMPHDEELLSEMPLPEGFCDASFENDIIQSMMYLIVHRNDDTKYGDNLDPFQNPVTAKRFSKDLSPIEFTKSKIYKRHQSETVEEQDAILDELKQDVDTTVTWREKFDKILSYMRPVIADRAVTRFESKMWNYLEIIFKGMNGYNERKLKLLDQASECVDKIENAYDAYSGIVDAQRIKIDVSAVKKKSVLTMQPSIIPTPYDSNLTFANANIPLSRMDILHDEASFQCAEGNKSLHQLGVIEKKIDRELFKMSLFANYAMSDMLDIDEELDMASEDNIRIEDTCREEREAFSVDNPFETCFAYLYLIDRGSNLPWLGGVPGTVINAAAQLLPWSCTYDNNLYAALRERDENCEDDRDELITEADDCPEDTIEKDRLLYEQRFTNYHVWSRYGFPNAKKKDLRPHNFPQFVYSRTMVSMPRDITLFEDCVKDYKKSGLSNKHMDLIRLYISLGGHMAHRPNLQYFNKHESEIDENISEKLKKAVTEKNKEISSLKDQLYKAEKDSRENKKLAERIKQEANADKQELIELRELIYKMQNNDNDNDENVETTSVEFPYTAKSRLVIYGGHDSWLRAIKPLLPNVRFIPPHANPDPNLIRNADIVWMQSNAMPHCFYNKIMDIARQNNIPIKYFAYASAKKCAIQLAEYDSAD